MAKKKTLTQRQNEIENKLDTLIEMMLEKRGEQTETPEPASQPPPKEDFIHSIKDPEATSGSDPTHNYGRKEQMSKIKRPNVFNDDGKIEKKDKKVIGTQTYSQRRPAINKIRVRCISCSQDDKIFPSLVYDIKRYKCNDCSGLPSR